MMRCGGVLRWLVAACWLIASLAVSSGAAAQDGRLQAMEPAVKAAYLFKFGGYVEWPPAAFASRSEPFIIGVLGDDPVADALVEIAAGRTIHGRAVSVRKLQRNDAVTDLHVLFIGRARNGSLHEFLGKTVGASVLTVTEVEQPGDLQGVINFVTIDRKIRFEVLLQAAAVSNLGISARLLTAAYKVARRAS